MELNLIEQHISTPASGFQMRGNRVIHAANLFAQGALLLQQESLDLLNLRHAARLRLISNGIQRLVPALQRLGRATTAPQFVPAREVTSREAAL